MQFLLLLNINMPCDGMMFIAFKIYHFVVNLIESQIWFVKILNLVIKTTRQSLVLVSKEKKKQRQLELEKKILDAQTENAVLMSSAAKERQKLLANVAFVRFLYFFCLSCARNLKRTFKCLFYTQS